MGALITRRTAGFGRNPVTVRSVISNTLRDA